jgi:hypothetical protein
MITRFLTGVTTIFNPFSPRAKTARIFLALFPPNARQTVKIDTKMLPRLSRERSSIWVKFSSYSGQSACWEWELTTTIYRGWQGDESRRWDIKYQRRCNGSGSAFEVISTEGRSKWVANCNAQSSRRGCTTYKAYRRRSRALYIKYNILLQLQ